ncbi:MAG: glutamine--fructose-6-phosphate aminotransferase, partial [Gluconobacter sp.]
MCGICGVVGHRPATPIVFEALRRLEYRGYDSAGIATLTADGTIDRRRAAGKLDNLEAVLKADPLTGTTGIGHTRWATHGAPTEANAHPHAAGRVAIVHNGIIENFATLKAKLESEGRVFLSDTDSETVAHLVDFYLDQGKA